MASPVANEKVVPAGEGSSAGGPSSANPPKNAKRFVLKKLNAIAFWSWDIKEEVCPICKYPNMDFCISCQTDNVRRARAGHGECSVALGVCNHAYHSHCLTAWFRANINKNCPLDNETWMVKKYFREYRP